MKPIPLRLLYISYASAFLGAALIYFALNGVDLLGRNPKALYFVNVLSIVLTLTGCYVAVSFDRFGFIKRRLHNDNPDVRRHAARLVPFVRIEIFSFLLYYNTALYCLAVYAQSTLKYCLLISLALGILVFPRADSTQPPQS
ncbi:MAG: hypothetical protein ACFNP8_07345 [Alloprevotella sp.]